MWSRTPSNALKIAPPLNSRRAGRQTVPGGSYFPYRDGQRQESETRWRGALVATPLPRVSEEEAAGCSGLAAVQRFIVVLIATRAGLSLGSAAFADP